MILSFIINSIAINFIAINRPSKREIFSEYFTNVLDQLQMSLYRHIFFISFIRFSLLAYEFIDQDGRGENTETLKQIHHTLFE